MDCFAPPLGAFTFKLRLGFWSVGARLFVGGGVVVLNLVSLLTMSYKSSFLAARPNSDISASLTLDARRSVSGTIGKLCSLVSDCNCCNKAVFFCKSVGKSSVRDSCGDKEAYGQYCLCSRHSADLGTKCL